MFDCWWPQFLSTLVAAVPLSCPSGVVLESGLVLEFLSAARRGQNTGGGDALHLGRPRRPELERCFDKEIRESFTLQSSSSFLTDGFVEIQEPGSSKTSQYKTV